MKVIISALFIESKVFIEKYKLKIKQDRLYKIYINEDSKILVIISGVGAINMAMATSYILYHYKVSIILNFGISASLGHSIGDLFLINKIMDFGSKKCYYPDILKKHNLNECDIITYALPQSDHKNILNNVHLIDMESSGFFQSALKFSELHKISLIKVVSDNANSGTLLKNLIEEICYNAFEKVDLFLNDYKIISNTILDDEDMENIEKHFSQNKLSATRKEIYKKNYIYNKLIHQ